MIIVVVRNYPAMINLNFDQFYAELKNVIDDPRPWMHTRYGDGEGIVLGHPQFTSEERAKQRWSKWLGHSDIDMKEYASLIRQSIRYADIVGVPCDRHQPVNQDWRNVQSFMIRYKLLQGKTLCCMDFTVWLQTKNLYKELFKNVNEIYYISCRDVSLQMKKTFNLKNVYGVHLPPQHRPFKGKVLTDEKHFPDIYEQIDYMCNNDVIQKNSIWLVGAGGLGKIYCMKIKQAGGIALDIGSIFDGWDQTITRSYLKDIKKFSL